MSCWASQGDGLPRFWTDQLPSIELELPSIRRQLPSIGLQLPSIHAKSPSLVTVIWSQVGSQGVEALGSGGVQVQQFPIPQAPQDLTGAEGIEAHEVAQARVINHGVAVGLEKGAEFVLAQIFRRETCDEGASGCGARA